MPINNDENGGVEISYVIPAEVLAKIPEYFYYAFYGELCAMYGGDIFYINSEERDRPVYSLESTYGWNAAFWSACQNTEQYWLFDYYDSLPWYDSDLFDNAICELVINKCHTPDGTRLFYYDYINRRMKEEGVRDF